MKTSLIVALCTVTVVATSTIARAEIVIGAFGPLTGGLAVYGQQLKDGVDAAVKQVNLEGGILGQKVVVKFYDDAGEPKQAVSEANRVVADDVHFIVGPILSGSSIPVSDIFADGNVMMITPTATVPALTERGLWNVFRTCGRDDQQASVAAGYILANIKDRRLAIIHDKTAYGAGLAEGVKKAINSGGMIEVMFDSITPGEKDFSALIARLKAEKIDVLYYGGYHAEAGLIIRQQAEQGLNALVMGGDGLSSTEFWAIAGSNGAGTLMTNSPDQRDKPAAQQVVARLRADQVAVETFTLNSYAGVQLLKAAIEKSGTADPVKTANALKGFDKVSTVVGDLSYDQKGDLTKPNFVVYKWKDGQPKELQP